MSKLTDARIRATKPGEKVRKLSDGLGLFLWITPNGDRGWRFHYRFDGKQTSARLGTYPTMTLKAARKARQEAANRLEQRLDPKPRAVALGDPPTGGPPTWGHFSGEFMKREERNGKAPKTLMKMRGQLRWSAPILDMPLDQIKPKDILAILEAIEAAGHFVTRKQARSLYSRIFRAAMVLEYCEGNPADALKGVMPPVENKHIPGLTNLEEIGGLIRAIRGFRGEPSTRAGLLTLAYTFLRQGEVRHMRWADVDLNGALIRIPGERMKRDRDHLVPLAQQMVELLREQHRWSGRDDLVFPGLRPGRPLSENTFGAALRALGISPLRHKPHGFRTTASTLLNEAGWNRDWIERQLAHVEGNTVRAAYNAAEYLDGRRLMMQAYADKLDNLAEDDLDILLE